MANRPYPGFLGSAYTSQSPIFDCETLINFYPEFAESRGAKSPMAYYPTPGCEEFAMVAQVGGKAIFSTSASGGRCFAVIGQRLYEIFEDGTTTERGSVAIDSNPATITSNGDGGDQLLITAGTNAYSYDLSADTLTAVASLAGKATSGGFAYSYGLVFDQNTGTMYQSDLLDFSVFDPTNFYQRNIQADDWYAMYVTSQGQLFLPGTKTRDNYFFGNTFPLPFQAAQAGLQPDGIASTFSVCEVAGTICWLSTNTEGGYKVMAADGYTGRRISTHAIEYAISQYARVDDAIATSYTDQGHSFYLLKFPDADVTWCYDFATNLWHQRASARANGEQGAWRLTFHCFAFNRHLWLDSDSGRIYRSDVSLPYDVEERLITRERTAPAICVGHQVLDINEFEVLMQVGQGNQNEPGQTPTMALAISRDGGRTFGSYRSTSVGRVGEYRRRVRWQSNGSGRDVAFRIRMAAPIVNWRLVQAFLDLRDEQGRQIDLGRAA